MAEMKKKATRESYGEALAKLAGMNDKVIVFDADLAGATKTGTFKKACPERFFDCGIAEANMMVAAAGASTCGLNPFASTFAMFAAGRAYEQVRNGCAYSGFNVKFAFSHAGITLGEDGGSHQSIEDISLMRVIPGMTIVVPCDANETKRAVKALVDMTGPAYLRMARLPSIVFDEEMPFQLGKANVLRQGSDAVIFACGIMVHEALEAAKTLKEQGMSVEVVNVHTIKPIDRETILASAKKCGKVVTVEEHSIIGGLGDAVADVLIGNGDFKFKKIGVNDRFGQSGTPAALLEEYGLTAKHIAEAVKNL